MYSKKRPKEYWLKQNWNQIQLQSIQEFPLRWALNSNKALIFLCCCGRTFTTEFYKVTSGHSTSCGKCTWKSKDHWLTQNWQGIVLSPQQDLPLEIAPNCNKNFDFTCSCGNGFITHFQNVITGHTASCGKCLWKFKDYWLVQRWGKLRLDPEQEFPSTAWPRGCGQEFWFLCECGCRKRATFDSVAYGTSSCGTCNWKSKEYWLDQRWGKLRLDPNQELPSAWARSCNGYFWVLCDCGRRKEVLFYNLINTYSCGCLVKGNGEYSPAYEIYQFVKCLVFPTEVLFNWRDESINNREIDVFIPTRRLGIEYHGLIWHSDKFNPSGMKDYEKFLLCKKAYIKLVQVYSDEWQEKRPIIEAFLADFVGLKRPKIRIKPRFEVSLSTSIEMRNFLSDHHYLGPASGCVTITARYKEAIVGVWVFMKREAGTAVWHRACWDRRFKTWNPHEKALKLAIPELQRLGFTRVITFSDNRFHTGNLYEKLGFTFEREIEPNYYYVNDAGKRKTKYVFRVSAGTDEVEEARSKGWYRMFDSGKRRYSLNI
jgi:hypothetical protein